MEELIQWLCEIHPLSPECVAYLRRIIRRQKLRKNQLLLREGEICKNIYFIKKGLLRCYYVRDGVEVTDWLFSEGDTVVSINSFYDQRPGVDFIQALERCELFYITYRQLQTLFERYIEFNVVGRILTNKYLRVWHAQARNIRMLTAGQRYDLLMEQQPELINRVPVQYLASYLDMSKATLSRMRSRLN